MAIIDKERNAVVVRIVYDGPPHAGTTTSINVLGNILGRTAQALSAEVIDLRIDWLEYVGGFFKGYKIACQIVSTPTSDHLRAYRHLLLQTADVIVVVLDARLSESAAILAYFQNLQQCLPQPVRVYKIIVQANKQDQVDALSVIQLKELLSDYPEIKIVETTATLGKGLRETFVLTVRSAVERADALMSQGKLSLGKPEIETGEELLAWLQANCAVTVNEEMVIAPAVESDLSAPKVVEETSKLEISSKLAMVELPPSDELSEDRDLETLSEITEETSELEISSEVELPPSDELSEDRDLETLSEETSELEISSKLATVEVSALVPAETTELELGEATEFIANLSTDELVTLEESILISPSSNKRLPKMPDEDTPAQWLWPPLMGRQILTEVFKHALKPRRHSDGTWIVNGYGNWRFFSKPHWHYPNAAEARKALRVHISLHLQCSPILSEQRCIAVTQERDDTWRLWQILHVVPTLAEYLQQVLLEDNANRLVAGAYECASHYLVAYRQCHQYSPQLELSLENLGIDSHQQLIYLGTVDKTSNHLPSITDEELLNALKQAFSVAIVSKSGQLKVSVETIIEELAQMSSSNASDQMFILTTLAELFVESM